MATALSQSDTDTPFSDCSIAFLLPRTLGSSFSAGAATLESDDLDYVSSLFNSTALNNSTQLLEHAKMISNINCSSIPNTSFDDRDSILANRSHGRQIELQGKRARQRRPGLPGVERGGHVFNFSAKTTTVEFSQKGTSGDFSKRSCVESNSQSWPVIDYSCLQHISDPVEYFSTYRMLENAEKEVKKLKGEASTMLNEPHRRRDRQRRPGLPDLEGKKNVFKFPGTTGTVEDSQIKNFTQSNGASITDLTIASCSKEISQIKDSQTVEPESKLAVNVETFDSNVDKEIDELGRLLSKCRGLDNDGIANFVKETLQINPIHVENSRGLLFSVPRENKFKSPQLSQISPVANRNKIDGLSNSKGHLSLIIPQDDPYFPHKNDQDKQSDGSAELGSNCKVFCDDGLEKLPSSERGILMEDTEKLMSDCNDISVDGIAALDQETLKAKLFDAEMTDAVDHLSALKKPIPLMDIQGRLAHISALKRRISQSTIEGELLMFSYDDLEDSLISKSQEMQSLSPVDKTHLDVGQIACISVLSNLKRQSFEDKMHSPVAETSEEDKNLGKRKLSDLIGCQITLLEDTCQMGQGTVSDEEFASAVHRVNFEEAGQSSASVDCRLSESLANHSSDKLHQPFVNTDAPEQILQAEVPEDGSLPENLAMLDEQIKASCEVLNGRNKNEERSETTGGSSNRKLEREGPPPRKQRKRNSILRRKSLAGAGCVWESGVRRSTRIRMKPLQYWCGERFLYGRVHDSLTTVIGVKKFETPPQNGRKTIMKVKSFVSEEYADLVAQAALY